MLRLSLTVTAMITQITYQANRARIADFQRQAAAKRAVERRHKVRAPRRLAPRYRRLIEVFAAR
jgi:hypothetical protein